MSRRRRGALLLALALALGGMAAADVSRREAALAEQLAPVVSVVVARTDLDRGVRLRPRHLSIRRIPVRYAPVGAAAAPGEVVGERLAASVPAGGYIAAGQLAVEPAPVGAPVRRGERVVEVVARAPAGLVSPGARVDVLVTREGDGRRPGRARLALADVEVLAVGPAAPAAGDGPGDRITASLRVTLRQAVYLAAAETFAREVRLLPRAAADDGRVPALEVGEGL